MAFRIFKRLSELLDVDTSGVGDGDALTYDTATSTWIPGAGGGGGAPTTVDYLVGTASGDLSAEIVVGTAPGGELGGTWASPTVDATHSGSSHASVQTAAEATAAAALAAHAADTTGIHGVADTSALETAAGAQARVDAHVNDATDAHAGTAITNTPAGTIAATTVQAAINELDSEKAAAASAVMDGDAAGGVLSGTYPNPGFAADMATQAELDAHTADTSAAHAASAISADSTTLVGTGTDVQAVLEELDNGIADHLADATAAHAATAIAFTPAGTIAATDVQAAIEEVASEAGGAVDPVEQMFGTPTTAFEFDSSSLTGLTAVGSSPDVEAAHTVVPGHYYVERRTNSGGLMGRYAAVTAPFTAIAKVTDSNGWTNFNKVLMFVGASGVVNNDVFSVSSVDRKASLDRWNASTAFSSAVTSSIVYTDAPFYFAIKAASDTDVDYLISRNGYVWMPFVRTRNPSITIALVGIAVSCESAGVEMAAAFDFLRIWDSAKTFRGSV